MDKGVVHILKYTWQCHYKKMHRKAYEASNIPTIEKFPKICNIVLYNRGWGMGGEWVWLGLDLFWKLRTCTAIHVKSRWPVGMKRNLKQSMRKWERKREDREKRSSRVFLRILTPRLPSLSSRSPTPHYPARSNTQIHKYTDTHICKYTNAQKYK